VNSRGLYDNTCDRLIEAEVSLTANTVYASVWGGGGVEAWGLLTKGHLGATTDGGEGIGLWKKDFIGNAAPVRGRKRSQVSWYRTVFGQVPEEALGHANGSKALGVPRGGERGESCGEASCMSPAH